MAHRIKSVEPLGELMLSVKFLNGIEKRYDLHQLYPMFPQFEVLQTDKKLYRQVKVDVGGYGISWNDDLDLDAEEIWENGIETGDRYDVDITEDLAESIVNAREAAGLTQKQLSELTGIYQADISKIERGLANPSLSTLKRLADGLGKKLRIEFF